MDATMLSSRRRNYFLVSHRRDQFIEFIKGLLHHAFVLDALGATAVHSFKYVEELIDEWRADGSSSRLSTAVPTIGVFFTPLPLAEAWTMYDARYRISRRRFVSPSFNEVREILNMAQILAFRGPSLKFVSFDGDCTLYSDGKNFSDPELAELICRLLRDGVKVALVTAAGYGYSGGEKYADRLHGLLQALETEHEEVLERFFVVGGECNYLLQLERTEGKLQLASREEQWTESIMAQNAFTEPNIKALLDVAEASLKEAVADLELTASRIIRKPRAVGLIDGGMKRECLDEAVLRVQDALRKSKPKIPFCAFNGGSDVWVDCGNKRVGVCGLQSIYGLDPANCLHIGDQFLHTGNDVAARGSCPCLWITKPSETKLVLEEILKVHEPPPQ